MKRYSEKQKQINKEVVVCHEQGMRILSVVSSEDFSWMGVKLECNDDNEGVCATLNFVVIDHSQ